ncbi:multidrug resistance protein, MATE family [Humidesulfovibrio mexicanus]|uniref:Multidrug-efflux transporter n=1 Tax=Humidesulfovibrio mexicanus TaxID=147047 RepID=A0A239ABD4_9BACT|nr:MATE family efflux transporter [Humidesulfovibrio mexicanus]SNR92947.1 multidrug resistance protein, MATE family [Humidesulfovibrio mexicanus]
MNAAELKSRWRGPCGCGEVLRVGAPLMVSMGSNTLMQFTDRIFLGRHDVNELAAAVPGGMAAFLLVSFFMGVASCVGVLVAQYHGACRPERVGPALWAGVWFSLASGALLALLAGLGGPLFELAGHPEAVRGLEADYFSILSLGGGWVILGTALSGYFSGLGRTVAVMAVNIIGTAANIPLDYALIFGAFGAPEMGIRGAAIATLLGAVITCLLFVLLLLAPEAQKRHHVRTAWRPEADMLARLAKIGLPAGVQFFLDIMAITGFSLLIGRMGLVELSATNIAFSVNGLTYLPAIGLSIAVSVLVGRSQGQGRADLARRATANALFLAVCWMAAVGLIFLLVPGPLLELFRPSGPQAASAPPFADIRHMGVLLLRYVALYGLVDAVTIVCFGALKGAGDTRFVMLVMLAASIGVLVLPAWWVVENAVGGIHGPWLCLAAYVGFLAVCFGLRWRSGAWARIRVIESAPGQGCR